VTKQKQDGQLVADSKGLAYLAVTMKAAGKRANDFDDALSHHRAGRLQQAEARYRAVLASTPDHAQANFLLGALCLDSQRLDEALTLSLRAAELDPNNAHYHSNCGEALRRLGQFERAAEELVRAVSLKPDMPEASFNLAATLSELGQAEAALTCLVRAADVAPERYAIQFRLAQALAEAGDLSRAVPHYQTALALNPQSVEALLAISAALRELKRSDGAVAMARRALLMAPKSAAPHVELARALAGHERAALLPEAEEQFREALRLDPRSVDAHFGLGCLLVDSGRVGEALEHFRSVVSLAPRHAVAAHNLAYLSVFAPSVSSGDSLVAARAWAKTHAAPLKSRITPHTNERSPERKLRIGYLGIFQDHATGFFFSPLLEHHNRSQFELFAYSINAKHDATTERHRTRVDHFRDISATSDRDVATMIREDGIDILVDFNMHMANSRLAVSAEKPAPIQICWLAYPGTTGLDTVDYRISDETMDPEQTTGEIYSERVLRLPESFWCYDPLSDGPELCEPPALKNGHVTFGSLNAYWKTHPALFERWSKVLQAVPNSHFLLYAPNAENERLALAEFAKHGIDTSRIHFQGRVARPDFLAAHNAMDIGLDTLPYSGHTTSLDGLWMGVPIVTLIGATAAGRMGLSVLRSVGLPELVAETESQFVEIAVNLSRDLPALTALRAKLRTQMRASIAMDGAGFARHFEAALRRVWIDWCDSVAVAQ